MIVIIFFRDALELSIILYRAPSWFFALPMKTIALLIRLLQFLVYKQLAGLGNYI